MNNTEYNEIRPKPTEKIGSNENDSMIPHDDNGESDDWRRKWNVPLAWANSLICESGKNPKDSNFVKIQGTKEIIGVINKFEQSLNALGYYYMYQTPGLINQAITLAVWFWFFIGIFASQGTLNQSEDHISIPVARLFNFPMLHCVEYMLIFGWLRTVIYLRHPFGRDK